eukprot:CAMPEP_0116034570 /NCGR_PEP_ID=MMETSP0321-20121206/19703_1 /TAXON_ID=163516 /ORGANISM="Leptocylindrus danicus var. danicus, Strain B650" /LENGTH=272 /DNA_ID=CAMNT_0003510941 /DNA_START=122 /DNA_END=940 /DNA_ORIENTATION=+
MSISEETREPEDSALESQESFKVRASINHVVKRAARRLMPSIGKPRTEEQILKKTIKDCSRMASSHTKDKNFKGAIEQYEKALEAAYELYGDEPDDDFSKKHNAIQKIRESIADVYSLEGSHEEALELYTSIKEDLEISSRKYKDLEKKEVAAMNKVNTSRKQRAKNQIDQIYQIGLINVKIGNYRKAKEHFLRALAMLKMRYGVTHDKVLIIREHLGDLHVLQFEVDEARLIYESILKTLSEKRKDCNMKHYDVVKQKLKDLKAEKSMLGY